MARVEKTLKYRTETQNFEKVFIGSCVTNINKAHAKQRLKVLNQGHIVIEENGDIVWRERHEVIKGGRYIWDDDRERVKVELKEFIKPADSDGQTEARIVRIVWGSPL